MPSDTTGSKRTKVPLPKPGKLLPLPGNKTVEAGMIEETIAMLEKNQAGNREQEQEIERDVKKANRELATALEKCDSPVARFDLLHKRWTALVGEMRKLERDHITAKRRHDQMQKEKDSAKSELSKVTIIKDRLEKLSRETSTENRKLRADLQQVKEEDAKKRDELQDLLAAVTVQVQQVTSLKEKVVERDDGFQSDEALKRRFKSLVEQFDLRETCHASVLRSKELEIIYHTALLEQQRRDQEMESTKSDQLTRQVSTFSQTETELRSQLNIYVEKFKQVEDTLNSSNDLFLTFRKEMEEMSRKTKRLEKENAALTKKHDAMNQSIIKMAEERASNQKEMDLLQKKNESLEKLCRGMQAQGRGQAIIPIREPVDNNEDGTESEYDYEEDEEDGDEPDSDEDGSDDYDDDEDSDEVMEPPTTVPKAPLQKQVHSKASIQSSKLQNSTPKPMNGVKPIKGRK